VARGGGRQHERKQVEKKVESLLAFTFAKVVLEMFLNVDSAKIYLAADLRITQYFIVAICLQRAFGNLKQLAGFLYVEPYIGKWLLADVVVNFLTDTFYLVHDLIEGFGVECDYFHFFKFLNC